ncbi:DnaJ domain-containing protein [Halorhabdus rudnickae]|uniref:DnaJ domain-containing protein n=1 Tax=Halorhabdus rudnickae TaxID=1775544 RepID=UPI00108442E2|nr:DnaJ domain-containing protein [Halorhabdus rudnickae]
MVRTFYDVLEISPGASDEDVKAAYRERLKDTHPDVCDDASTTDAVKAVIEAGDILTDEEERQRYDRLGHETYVDVTDTHDPTESVKSAENESGQATASPDADTRDFASEPNETGHREQTDRADHDRSTGQSETGHRRQSGGVDNDFAAGRARTNHRRQAGATDSATANVNPGGVDWASRTRAPSYESTSTSGYAGPRSERSILLLSTLIAYPVLAVSSLVPQLPLVFRLVIGGCAIALVIYLVAVPSISIPVFSFWTLITGVVIALGKISVLSIETLGALVATAGPLALAVFSYRWL